MRTPAPHTADPTLRDEELSGRTIVLIVGLAFALAWLVCLPLWISPAHLNSRWMMPAALTMMWTPGISAIAVLTLLKRRDRWKLLGLPVPKPAKRFVVFCLLALVVPLLLTLLALVSGALLGLYPADLTHYSAFAEVLKEQLAKAAPGTEFPPLPVALLAWAQVINCLIGAVINTPAALGEELLWRGLLFGWLRDRIGAALAIVTSGVIWGLWHAPLILLGYNYPGHPAWLALLAMCGFTTVLTPTLVWLRERSASVWPAAIGHGMINASAGLLVVFAASGHTLDNLEVGIIGWSGWIPAVLLGLVLLMTGSLRRWKPKAWFGGRDRLHGPAGQS